MNPTRSSYNAVAAALLCAAPIAATAQTNNAFNPQISLILQGQYAHYSSDLDAQVPGVVLGPETGLRAEGMSLGESELALEANIDHRFHGWTTIAFEQEDGETVVAVEEAYIDTISLPAGLAVKFGRFLSDIGYHNRQHSHSWDFADAPLVYRSLFANGLSDDGIQMRWLAPTDLFIELGAEAFRGDGFPAGGEQRTGIGLWTTFAHIGGDWGLSSSWRAGVSHLRADAISRQTGEAQITRFTGDSQITGIDWVYKWSPNGNPSQRHLSLQGEWFWKAEDGQLVADPEGSADQSDYDGRQSGFYVQAAYQFVRYWRFGLRYDRLQANNRVDNPVPGTALETLADDANHPSRSSVMIDYSPSEFSRFRVQYNRDQSRPERELDHQILVQAIFSLGAHPAHQF